MKRLAFLLLLLAACEDETCNEGCVGLTGAELQACLDACDPANIENQTEEDT